MVLGDLNLHKWTLSIFVVNRRSAWAQTPLNNGLHSWLDNWRYNEGERWRTKRQRAIVCERQKVPHIFFFFFLSLPWGPGTHTHPQHCNLLLTPLPGKKVSWAHIQSTSCDTIAIGADCSATSLNVLLWCLSSCSSVDSEHINYS